MSRTLRLILISSIVLIAFIGGFRVLQLQLDEELAARLTLPERSFAHDRHAPPRVFVHHRPLHPAIATWVLPDPQVAIVVEPELEDGVTVEEVRARFEQEGAVAPEQVCEPGTGGRWVCRFAVARTPGEAIYDARVLGSDGTWVESRRRYRFQVLTPAGDDQLFPLRVPVERPGRSIDDAHRIDVVLARDPAGGYAASDFWSDLERAVYEDVLADPAYRWRDDQIGFWAATRPAFTRDYYSPRASRCGQAPWLDAWPSEVEPAEVVGVVHRRGSAAGVPEQPGAAGGVFRDCAGTAMARPGVGTFSAQGDRPLVLKHELGHAAFGLGDEYHETTETARVPGESTVAIRAGCCCLVEPAGGEDTGTGTGTGVVDGGTGVGVEVDIDLGSIPRLRCRTPDGSAERALLPGEQTAGLPACAGFEPEGDCHLETSAEPFCPPKVAGCVLASAFLGAGSPAADTARRNRFEDAAECAAARAAALAHPGVERAAAGLGECRVLCGGPGQPPCACVPPGEEDWIVDLDPESSADDTMDAPASVSSAHGSTCAWCIETSLCVRWQVALGDSAAEAWEHCSAPEG